MLIANIRLEKSCNVDCQYSARKKIYMLIANIRLEKSCNVDCQYLAREEL